VEKLGKRCCAHGGSLRSRTGNDSRLGGVAVATRSTDRQVSSVRSHATDRRAVTCPVTDPFRPDRSEACLREDRAFGNSGGVRTGSRETGRRPRDELDTRLRDSRMAPLSALTVEVPACYPRWRSSTAAGATASVAVELRLSTAHAVRRRGLHPRWRRCVLRRAVPERDGDLDILPGFDKTITPERHRRRYTHLRVQPRGGSKEPHAEERKTRACVGFAAGGCLACSACEHRPSIPSMAAPHGATLLILYT